MEECNFKIVETKGILNKEYVRRCRLTNTASGVYSSTRFSTICSGEENCILFQLYVNSSKERLDDK